MHELDFTKGQAAIAFRGATPWHGLGESILPQDDIDAIRIKAGIDYDVVKTPIQFQRKVDRPTFDILSNAPRTDHITETWPEQCVLYRSDTGYPLSTVSSKYNVVQPRAVIDFYRDLSEKFGFQIEVVGALKGGRKVWALANTEKAFNLRGEDKVKGYLLLATSYDGTMATQARFTSIRVVCNNTLTMARSQGQADVTIPHSRVFDAAAVKEQLHIGESWEAFNANAKAMSERIVSQNETIQFFMNVYYGLATPEAIGKFHEDPKNAASAEKVMKRLTTAFFESPGAQLASARGTLWGALNAVTFDVDHQLPSRSSDTRLDKAWFGQGNSLKQRALDRALALVA